MPAYLESLTLRLAAGLETLPDEARERHAAFLKTFQQPDGGFRRHEGGSDLYYTGFALRGLALLAISTVKLRIVRQHICDPNYRGRSQWWIFSR